jgi:hypothetical protein
MGRDRMRVLLCAIASIALIIAGALVMDWYRLSITTLMPDMPGGGKVAIDLRNLHVCHQHGCVTTSISPMPGMFPTLATVTLWSSLGFAALVAFQAGTRVLTGAAADSFTKVGYMLALLAISLAVATAYLFGPEDQGPITDVAAKMGISLPRTWAPLTLIAGLAAGFAALYMTVAPESSDLGAAYMPVTVTPPPDGRPRTSSIPLPTALARPRSTTGAPLIARPRSATGAPPVAGATGLGLGSSPALARAPSDAGHAIATPIPRISGSNPGIVPPADLMPAITRARTGSIPALPAHLRNRLQYLAITAEITAGGIDARREDGTARLVLWRDVVGVVVRRMPPAYDNATFVDIISTAGSTLRIAPWTRLTGEPIEGQDAERPRGVIERVIARCPAARLDRATRQFLDTGEVAQLPDLETLQAHDGRLA